MIANLKLCPFCGGTAMLSHGLTCSYVKCEICDAESKRVEASLSYCADIEAVKAWNKRAYETNERSDETK